LSPAALAAAFLFLAVLPAGASEQARVRHVIDGDTVVLENGEHVRLIGINAPEYTPWKNRIEPYGYESTVYLKRLLEGKTVRIEADVEKKDRYRRTLAYLWLTDGQMVNRLLVREGMARARYYRPNGAHRAELEADEREASSAGRGLWAEKSSSAPVPAAAA
jgi:micrococcal nuclease